jgi:hypothetical protein
MKQDESGQALPLIVLLVGMVLMAGGYGLGLVHNVLQDEARAQTAADAAALAGAMGNEQTARTAAEANGGRLLALTRPDGDTAVTVRVGKAEAKARAHQGQLE